MKWNLMENEPPQKKTVILRMEFSTGEITYMVAYWKEEVVGGERKVIWAVPHADHLTVSNKVTMTHWADPVDITFPKKEKKKVINRFELMEL